MNFITEFVKLSYPVQDRQIMTYNFLIDSVPSKNLPNHGGHQAEKDYIYYDRDAGDKSNSILSENNEGIDKV